MEELVTIIILVLIGYGGYAIYKQFNASSHAGGTSAGGARSTPQRTTGNTRRPASRISVTETGRMIYMANGANPGQDNVYHFNYKKKNGGWRAYILRMPPLNGRNSSAAVTHRLSDQDGSYVCWDSTIYTLKEMQTTSKIWADHIQKYIQTGRTFG